MTNTLRDALALGEQVLALVDQHREAPFRSIEWLGEQVCNLALTPSLAPDDHRTPTPEQRGEVDSYAAWQQKRGRAEDLIDWAIGEFDGWMLDDHYDPRVPLDKIIDRFRQYRADTAALRRDADGGRG